MAERTQLFGPAVTLNAGLPISDEGSTVHIDILHELGYPPEDAIETVTLPIDPFSPPTQVTMKSYVLARTARRLGSPQYLAALRRRKSLAIAELIERLVDRAGDDDWVVWTQEPLDRLRQLIHQLSEAEQLSYPQHEGNSCEILRQIRDTFVNTGWKRYREAPVRDQVTRILRHLGKADEVTPEDVNSCMDRLLDIALDVAVGMPLFDDEEDEVPG